MKKRLLFWALLVGLLTGCRTDDELVLSDSHLYQRWRSETGEIYITFLYEGIILYGEDGTNDGCCTYNRFFRLDGNRLVFQDVPEKSLPVQVKSADCSNVRCYRPNPIPNWQIVSLTADRLQLSREDSSVITYRSAP